MKNKTMNQNAMIAIVIGAILLIAGGYQVFNPVLAVSAPDDSTDMQMLATTTFTVSEPNVTCTDPTPHFDSGCELLKYEDNLVNGDGVIRTAEMVEGILQYLSDDLTMAELMFLQGPYSSTQWDTIPNLQYEINSICTGCYAPPVARIDDDTDTLVTDKTSYRPGDSVTMIAWGENVGGATWSGKVVFTVTQPDGTLYTTKESTGVSIGAGLSESYVQSFTIPSPAAAGTWNIDSTWIDSAGNVHARASIDLGTETVWGYDINILGALIALIGLVLIGYGLSKRKS